MIQTVLQNCVTQMPDVAPLFFNDFLEPYLRPRCSKGDDVKDSRGAVREEFVVSFRPLPLPVCYQGFNS